MVGDLASTVRRWETYTIAGTVIGAVLAGLSSLLTYIPRLEKRGQHVGLVASVVILFGALSSIKYTMANRALQRQADIDNLQVHRQLTTAANQASAAVNELAAANNELAATKERLQRVESQQQWRTLTAGQMTAMVGILSQYSGSRIVISPVGADNEANEFANQLDAVFKRSGWETSWLSVTRYAVGPGAQLPEGLTLQFPTPDIAQHSQIGQALIRAIRMADARVEVADINGNLGPIPHTIRLEIGRKQRPTVPTHESR